MDTTFKVRSILYIGDYSRKVMYTDGSVSFQGYSKSKRKWLHVAWVAGPMYHAQVQHSSND